MSAFNLIDEPWIPVRYRDGRRAELGVRDALLQSKEIAEIEDQSPLVVAALHRFLLAILYRALEGPTDIDEARVLFRDGISGERVVGYLTKWRGRFWLFDDHLAFWQVPQFLPKEWRAWTALAVEHNADNAKVLFDHVSIESAGSVPNAAAARWLLAVQAFAVSSGKSELAHTSGAPSATAVMVLPLGVSLQDTLIFGLVPQNKEVARGDLPVWERNIESLATLKGGPEREALGIADLYTWRSRTVRLLAEEDGRISKVGFASGVGYATGVLSDPMVAYREDEKLGKMPMQLRERGLWRDFDSLLPDSAALAPAVMSHASRLTHRDTSRRPRSVLVVGQSTNKAKIEFWRAERFALPEIVADGDTLRIRLRHLLNEAEKSQRALWSASQSFARDVIGRGARMPAAKDVTAFVQQMDVNPAYWTMLEARFHDLLRGFTAQQEFEAIQAEWLSAIRDALKQAWQTHASTVSFNDAWAIRALVRAEKPIAKELARLDADIKQLTEEEVAA